MSAAEYRALLREARKEQLSTALASVQRIERVWQAAVDDMARMIYDVPSYMLTPEEALSNIRWRAMLADLSALMDTLREQNADLVNAGMLESAQQAADREARVAALVKAPPDPALDRALSITAQGGVAGEVTVRFGQVALGAVRATAARVYRDGWKLSDRLYNLDAETRAAVQDTLVQGVTEGVSARELGDRLRERLAAAGSANPKSHALRIARTEINTSHREAHIASTRDHQTGGLKSYIKAVGWRLSASHPEPDICDVWASDDTGLGPGNYLPDDVPFDHPHGLCYTTSVLVEYPDVAGPGKAPDAGAVDEAQVRYYAERVGDGPAQRRLAAIEAGRSV